MTYGWAILIVLAVTAALLFLGVFDIKVPSKCIIDPPFSCEDIVFKEGGIEISLLANNIANGLVNGIGINGQECNSITVNDNTNGQLVNGKNSIKCYGVNIKEGYDGEYGIVSIFGDEEKEEKTEKQLSLF